MKKIICKKEYDTETAELLKKQILQLNHVQ